MTARPQMFLDRPPVLYIWRPFYRHIVVPVILPFLSLFRAYFTAPCDDLRVQLEELRHEMAQINTKLDMLGGQGSTIVGKIETTYLDSLGQWSAMEHLITSSLRLSDRSAAKRADTLQRIDSRQSALLQAVERCLAEQKVLDVQLAGQRSDQQNTWREMEGLILSLLAQPVEHATAVGSRTDNMFQSHD